MSTSSSTSRTTDVHVGRGRPPLPAEPADVGRAQPGQRPRARDHVEHDGRGARAVAAERPAERVGERARLVVDRAREARRTCRPAERADHGRAAPRRRAAPSRRRPAAAAAARAPGATSSRADRARPVGQGSSRVTIGRRPPRACSRPSPCSLLARSSAVQGALAGAAAGAEGRGLDRRGARPRRRPAAARADAQREIASLTKLMTAHLVLRYARLGTVVASPGADAVAVGESSVPLALGERQTVQVAAGGADRALGQRRGDRARARRRWSSRRRRPRRPGRRASSHRPLPADPVARFVLLMNAEARALGLRDTVYRTPHGLDEPGAHSSARDVLTLARLDMASPIFRALARRQVVTIPGHANLPTSNTLLRGLRRPRRRQDRAHRRGRLEPRGERRARRRAAVRDPARGARRGAVATATSRACSTGASTASSARGSCAPGQAFGHSGNGPRDRREGPLGRCSIRASRCASAIVLPRRLEQPGATRRARSATSSCAARAACSGASPLVADRAGGGHPALVPWLRSLDLPSLL